MRHLVRMFTSCVVAVGMSAMLVAQEIAPGAQLATRGPRFLVASTSRGQPTVVDARTVPVLRRRVDLDLDGVTLEEALTVISRQAGLRLVYSKALVPLESRVRIQARGISVGSALTEALLETDVDVLLKANAQAVLLSRSGTVDRAAQQGTVTGRVTDGKTGSGLGGVDVSLEGTRWRTTSDADGQYRLTDVALGRYTVLARRIGYGPERRVVAVTAGQEITADVALQAKAAMLADVVVTAQKREERLINVPQSVSVLPADALARMGAAQFRDFANTVPGLSFTTVGAGQTTISLRGVTPFASGSTVGIYVDDVPYGSSTNHANASQLALDVGLFDLDRVEVLRGPQGTLYGASTMGGLLKYVSKQPDATRFGVDAQAGTSSTGDGGVSANGMVAVNTPIVANNVAVRLSGFYSRDGGYVDNPTLRQRDVNQSDIYGGRVDLSLTPTDALAVRVSGFLQDISRDGKAVADYTRGGVRVGDDLERPLLMAEPFHSRLRVVSGTVTYDAGPAVVTSISSYQAVRTEYADDFSVFLPVLASLDRFYSTVGLGHERPIDKFVQEVRIASEGTGSLEWLVGGFYTHESTGNEQVFLLRDLAGQSVRDDLLAYSAPSHYEEYAAFGNLTWHLNSKFNVSGGVRFARNDQDFTQNTSGSFVRPTPTIRSHESVFTYLANARYHFSDQATGYLRFATGYQPGGPNFVALDPLTNLPIGETTFESTRLESYEVGFKAETADRRLGFDMAVYYTDWSNPQIYAYRNNLGVVANAAGGATTRGAELTLTARPISSFTATGAFAYQDPELSEADPDLTGAKGEQLPNVPRFTAALNADYAFTKERSQPTVGATLRHVSDRSTAFGPAAYRLPEYTTADLRAGFVLNRVDVQLYLRNLFDERGQLSGGGTSIVSVSLLQPRTIGMLLSTHF